MSKRTIRGASAAVLALGLVTTTFTSAQAADRPTPGLFNGTSSGRPAPSLGLTPTAAGVTPADRAAALRLLGKSPSALAGTASGITELRSYCPTGQSPSGDVYGSEGFDAGLPFPDISQTSGFTVTGTGTPEGPNWATSSLPASATGVNFLTSNHDPVPQTGKVYLTFAYRTVGAPGSASYVVNNTSTPLEVLPTWAYMAVDVTSAVTNVVGGDGTADVSFRQTANIAAAGSLEVDDVALYGCAKVGLRGDWTGQGTVDLMGTRTDGTLWVYEGNGNGTVKAGVKVGGGWAPFTWQGSPGDVGIDRHTDLYARRSDGSMWFYPGKGNGALGAGIRVGGGWNAMTSISTPGDYDDCGWPELIARRADGTLHLYWTYGDGTLGYGKQIGAGWNGMTSIIGMGDLNGDGLGDVVAVRNDGVMFSYLATSTGLAAGVRVGAGWKALSQLTSPGDMTGDGRGDLVGRRADGSLWSYSGKAGGGVNAGVRVGGGWNSMLRIL
jgi:FG-GAP-like repeat